MKNHHSLLSLILFSILLFCSSCESSSRSKLYLFTWSEMFTPELIEQFETEFNCQVCMTIYDSNESMYAKLKLGSSGYDLIFPSGYFMQSLIKQKMIIPLDPTKIPNTQYLDNQYFTTKKNNEYFYGIPFLVTFSGIAYREDKLTALEPSFNVFDRNDLKGRMTILNDMRDALGAALKKRGYSVNSRNPKEINEAAEQILSWKKNIAKFESEQYKSGIASSEFLAVQAYSTDIAQVRRDHKEVAFIYPNEGAILSVDYMAIPKDARNQNLAHAFINFMIEPKNAAKNMTHIYGLVPVKNAYELLDNSLRSDPLLFPSEKDKNKMESIQDVEEDIVYYYKAWDYAKSAQ